MTGPFVASIAAHAALAAVLLLGGRLRWPAPPIPIELLVTAPRTSVPALSPPSPSPSAARPPVPEAAPRKRLATHRPSAKRSGAGPRPTPREENKPPTAEEKSLAASDLRSLAHQESALVVLLRTNRLRSSPYRADVEALLGALPDHRTLLAGTGLSVLDDLEALLIGTTNPRDVTATFLAARHPDTEALRALASRPLPAGDPRIFRALSPGLTVLTPPDGADRLDAAGSSDGGIDDPEARWRAALEHFDAVSDTDEVPVVEASGTSLSRLIRLGAGLPTPEHVQLALSAEASPRIRVHATFLSPEDAGRFLGAWPQIVARWRATTGLLGIGGMLDGLLPSRSGAELSLKGRLPAASLRLGLSWARALLPPPSPEPRPIDGGGAAR